MSMQAVNLGLAYHRNVTTATQSDPIRVYVYPCFADTEKSYQLPTTYLATAILLPS